MGEGYTVSTGTAATALAAATAKTLINIISGANAPALLVEIGISFDGVTASAVPVLVELCQSTQAGAGTVGSSPTPLLIRANALAGVASQATAGINYSAEPTVLTPMKQWLVTPNGGLLILQFPLGREPQGHPTASTAGKGLALRANAPAIVNVRAYFEFEE